MTTETELRRIKLLSARFYELQGLRIAYLGACITAVFGSYLLLVPEPTETGAWFALLGAAFAGVVGMGWVNRYYRTTFGRQVVTRRPPPRWVPIGFALYWIFWMWLDKTFPAIPPGGPTLSIVSLLSVFVAIRDWPWRAYYLIAPAAVGMTLALSASATGDFPRGLTLASVFFALGASMVVIGFLDHRVLVRLFTSAGSARSVTT